MGHTRSYILSIRVFLDTCNGCYKNIITINTLPEGPLSKLVRKLQMPQVSPFKTQTACNGCAYVLYSPNDGYNGYNGNNFNNGYNGNNFNNGYNGNNFNNGNNCNNGNIMNETHIPELFSFLISNGYTIDTGLTKLLNKNEIKMNDDKVLCFITYNT